MLRWKLVTLFLVLLASVAAVASAEPRFSNPYRIPTGIDPGMVVAGDLNGDGIADIVWTAPGFTSFSVLLSQPGGSWVAGQSIAMPSGMAITGCVLADVTRDHILDLVCAADYQFSWSMYVYPGHGDGTFGNPVVTPMPSSNGNYTATIVTLESDLDGNGVPDIYVNDLLNWKAYVLLSDGTGSFAAPIPTQAGTNQVSPISADVNGDGIPDLLFPLGPEVALGNGNGTFQPIITYTISNAYAQCAFHDMDGDGHLDAVCGYIATNTGDIIGQTGLFILHGNSDGSFNTNPIAQQTFGDKNTEYDGFGTLQSIDLVADLNGDGILDLIGSSGDGIAVLLGGPNLTFGKPLHYARAVLGIYESGRYQSQYIDVNGDGLPDVVASGPNGIYITYGKNDGTFVSAFAPEVTENIGYATVADFNGDGIPDVAATGDTAIKLSLGNGDGTFQAPVALPNSSGAINFSTPLSATNAHILHGDFNGDGRMDLLAIGSSSIYQYSYYVFFGNGDGTFQQPIAVPNTSTMYPAYASLYDSATADLNRDGRTDFVAVNSSTLGASTGQISAYLSDGSGNFTLVASNVPIDSPIPTQYPNITMPALADFNGDGKLDAAYGSLSQVFLVKGNGDGSFNSAATATLTIPAINGTASQSSIATTAGDIDGDGHQDIVLLALYNQPTVPSNPLTVAVWVYFGNGDGTFSAPVLALQSDQDYQFVSAADLEHDGREDIVLNTHGTLAGGQAVGVVSTLPGRTFGQELNFTGGTGLSSTSIADLNNDGYPDLIFANADYNIAASSVTVLMNLTAVNAVTGNLYATPEPSLVTQPFTLTAALTAPDGSILSGTVQFSIDGVAVGSAPLANNSATLGVAGIYAIGSHVLGAYWPGNSTYDAVTLTGHHMVVPIPTTTTITSSLNPAVAGATVTFTATTASTQGTPTGSITFSDNGGTLASVPLVNGVAQYSTASLAIGSHAIQASYPATGNYAASSASLTQVITAQASTVSLSGAPNPAYLGQAVLLNATVTPQATGVPTGTVLFYDGTTPLGTSSLNASGIATLQVSFNTLGAHSLTATYSGDTSFAPETSNPYIETIVSNPTAITVAAAPNPAVAFSPVVFTATVTAPGGAQAAGTANFYANGTLLGTGTLASGQATFTSSQLRAGVYTITASYPGTTGFDPATSGPYTLTVMQAATQTTLTSSANPSVVGSTVTFTAKVSANNTIPTGSVQFYDGSTALGAPVPLDAQGGATWSTASLALGTHPITAVYSGDANLLSSTSAILQQVIVSYTGDFNITINPTSASIYTGDAVKARVTISSTGGFNQPLTLSCANLPAETTCAFASTVIDNGSGTTNLVIQTTSPQRNTATAAPGAPSGSRSWLFAMPTALAFLVAIFLPGRRARRVFWMVLLVLCAIAGSGGCSSPTPISGGTPPGTYAIVVTASYPAQSPVIEHQAVLNLTVKSLF